VWNEYSIGGAILVVGLLVVANLYLMKITTLLERIHQAAVDRSPPRQ
jgi:hypothetical protein